ncbi:MFS transporter [Streptomyces sp. NRRL WC-3742]|uniref:MFS transporter n=1 Tax=Streptomyces sp. NRRL WC-3742 TaxID=1463934 RepID=UPI0007C508D2|nr:MFS transporter [Streptomyces sp. NRRL WC-3742]
MTTARPATPPTRDRPRLGRKFALLWSASSISAVGDGMRDSALPLLAVAISDSPGAVSLVTVAGTLPWLVMSLFGGVLADRADRRRLMWTIDLGRAAVVLGFACWVLLATPPLAALALLAFVLGCGETVFVNAATSALPDVVRPEQLDAANGRLQGSLIVGGHLIGPLLGSTLFAVAAGYPFTVDGLSFALAAALVAATGRSGAARAKGGKPVLGEIREGVRWLYAHREVRLLALLSGVAALAFYLGITMLVLLVTRTMDAPASAYGLVLAAGAIGGTAASAGAGRLGRLLGRGARIGLSFVLMGVSLLLTGLTSSVAAVAVLYAVASFGVVTWNVQAISLRQQAVPKELLGRVNSCYLLLSRFGVMTGAALSGWIASAAGVRAPLLVGGAALLAALVLVPRMARLERASAPAAGE